jgi:hypothetical protein
MPMTLFSRKFITNSLIFSAVFLLSSLPAISYAQFSSPGGELDLAASTDNPEPGQTVSLTLRSFRTNINAATISWNIDGKVQKKGVGETKIDVVTPPLGKATVIRVTVTTIDGKTFTTSLTIRSTTVDMIVETDGYVPVLYPGKINPVFQNTVKVTAIPHLVNSSGVEYNPQSLIYTWKKDDSVLEGQSGYGKQSVTILGDSIPREYTLTVTVTPRDSRIKAQGSALIQYGAPAVGFYVNDPLYGTLFNKAIISALRLGREGEVGIRAIPFGFNASRTNDNESLSFSWTVNGIEQENLTSRKNLILRAPTDGAGASSIQLTVKNVLDILQNAEAQFDVYYTAADAKKQNTSVTFQ